MSKVSTLFYRNVDGAAEMLEIPTIQSLTIPDNTTIPSKPTITGEYRNQYVAAGPVKVSFVAWLEAGQYLDDTMDVSTVLDKLIAIRDNRIKFNLTTSHTDEESRFMSDLSIENITFNRDTARRNRLVCTVNCTQLKFVDLEWKKASAVEIFGKEIFTANDTAVNKKDFVVGSVDDDFDLLSDDASWLNSKFNTLNSAYDSAAYASGLKQAPVSWQVKKAIEGPVPLVNDSYYYKLIEPIDMSVGSGSRVYNCNCSFQSTYGLSTSAKSYTVDLGQFVITINKDDGTLVSNFPIELATGFPLGFKSSGLAEAGAKLAAKQMRSSYGTTPYVYDFADTYPAFTIADTFEYIEPFDKLANYLKTANTSTDTNSTGSNVVVKDGNVWSYKIKDRYDFSIQYGNTVKKFTPDGGLKIDKYNLTTTADGFKPKISNDSIQSTFDDAFKSGATTNYTVTVVVITLGARLQVFLFSNTLFKRSNAARSGSTEVASGS